MRGLMLVALLVQELAVATVAAGDTGAVAATTAPTTDPTVAEALTRYQELDYAAVLPLLERALTRDDLGADDRRIALAYLGRTYAVFRRPQQAIAVFVDLLEIDPDFTVSADESPLIRSALKRARARRAKDQLAPAETEPLLDVQASSAPDTAAAGAPASRPASAEEADPVPIAVVAGAGVVGAVALGAAVAALLLAPWQPTRPLSGTLGRWELP